MGDGVLMEFASAVNAVTAAIELQRRMADANSALPTTRRIVLRIGINLGDIVIEGSDVYGDGVNIAARLESLAEPGAIYVSRSIHDQVDRKLETGFDDLGLKQSLVCAPKIGNIWQTASAKRGCRSKHPPGQLTTLDVGS
jgi:class 3 adenylate cyclase